MEEVLAAIQCLRVPVGQGEYNIHALIQKALESKGFSPSHEVRLGAYSRIDFLIDNIGIEVKRGRPTPKSLIPQLEKYLASDRVSALIVVVERHAALPRILLGKPVKVVSLNKLWGISL